MKFRKIKIVLIVKTFCLGISGTTFAATQFECDQDGKLCSCEIDPSSSISFTIDTKVDGDLPFKFRAPVDYFQVRHLTPAPNSTRDATTLFIHGENFKPWPLNMNKFINASPYITMLLSSYVPLERIGKSVLIVYSNRKARNNAILQERPANFGLSELLFSLGKKRVKAQRKVYLNRNEKNKITNVISCSDFEFATFQRCSHTIETRFIDVKISYGIEFLPQWRSIERKARAMVECFTSEYND